jgi:hypothetical protein
MSEHSASNLGRVHNHPRLSKHNSDLIPSGGEVAWPTPLCAVAFLFWTDVGSTPKEISRSMQTHFRASRG